MIRLGITEDACLLHVVSSSDLAILTEITVKAFTTILFTLKKNPFLFGEVNGDRDSSKDKQANRYDTGNLGVTHGFSMLLMMKNPAQRRKI